MPGVKSYNRLLFLRAEANCGPALARYWAEGAGSCLAIAGPAFYPYIHKVNFSRK